jgi:hypothetical protein
MAEVHAFAKKLQPSFAGLYRAFCEHQQKLGNLESVNIEPKNQGDTRRQNGGFLGSEKSKSEKTISFKDHQL